MKNLLVCWKENNENKWEMIKDEDFKTFGMKLLMNPIIDTHTIFIIPTNVGVNAIWLQSDTHKSNRVDFWNFFDDIGQKYEKPTIPKEQEYLIKKEECKDDEKYGWISPNGKYFPCCYGGHITLADKICFGMIETNNAERYLEEQGWCKIFKSLFDKKYSIFVGGKHTLTKEQMDTLIKLKLEDANGMSIALVKS